MHSQKHTGDAPLSPFGIALVADRAQALMDAGIDTLRALVRQHAVVILRGVGSRFADKEALSRFASAWGPVMPWSFGSVLEVEERPSPRDAVYDSARLPLHWDGMYREATPEFMMLYCARAPREGEGGRTRVVDTRRVARQAGRQTLERWRQVSVTYLKGGRVHYSGAAHSPLIAQHPLTGEDVIRLDGPYTASAPLLNEPVRIWHGIASSAVTAFEDDLASHLLADDCCLAHAWEDGDLMIADNFAVLHGRDRFTPGSRRTLWRVQVHAEPMALNLPIPDGLVPPPAPPGRPEAAGGH